MIFWSPGFCNPVFMVFLRHFACIGCRTHAAEVWRDRAKYERNGAKIVFIGNGQPEWIEKFRADLGIAHGIVLTDPTLQTFKFAGFKNGFFNLVQPQSAINAAKFALQGNKQINYDKNAGSHLQMGGIIAVNPQNKVIYHFVSDSLGDLPEEPHLEIIKNDEAI